jgi:hypothetical protein
VVVVVKRKIPSSARSETHSSTHLSPLASEKCYRNFGNSEMETFFIECARQKENKILMNCEISGSHSDS